MASVFEQMNLGMLGGSQGAIGANGAGGEKGTSIPLLSCIMPVFKDSKVGLDGILSANGFLGTVNGFLGPEKAFDRWLRGIGNTNTGSANIGVSSGSDVSSNNSNYFQNMVASSRSNKDSGMSMG